MKQIEIFEITSPCVGVCQSGPKGFCLGCYRTRDERLHWIKLEEDVQSKIVKACGIRKKRAQQNTKRRKTVENISPQLNLLDTPPPQK
ncbi:DUF1289 domain-containing protein [Paraglaciecola sp. 2405UD69-4]|uniref:DUF1289 domain-containing protein n=1 Tax=Paraglaciecola sp. 2405UD69-4 TaxID=3391836 RepID=UPI0039C95595